MARMLDRKCLSWFGVNGRVSEWGSLDQDMYLPSTLGVQKMKFYPRKSIMLELSGKE